MLKSEAHMTHREFLALVFILLCLCMPAQCITIGDAKRLPDTAPVTLTAKVVTFASTNYLYIEEDNRYSGIRVDKAAHGMKHGKRVDVSGSMSTDHGERLIQAGTVTENGTGSAAPLGVSLASVPGGDWYYDGITHTGQQGALDCAGLNNVGLLIRVWGSFSYTSGYAFSLSDGSDRSINCVADSSVAIYPAAQFAVVTGISSLFDSSPRIRVTGMEVASNEEVVSLPGTPSGDAAPKIGNSYFYTGGTAFCSKGHDVEYMIDWGDGASTAWSECKSAHHTWSTTGIKLVTVTARCKVSHVAQQSNALTVSPVVNTDYWERTSGPAGGETYSFVRTSEGHIFAGAERIYRSIDNGQQWMYLPGATASSLAINAQDHLFGDGYGGVYRSTDDGDHWTLFTRGLPQSTWCFAVAVAPNGTVFAGFDQYGVYRSTDNGERWTRVSSGIPDGTCCCSLAITSGGTIYAGTYDEGVFRSADNGDTWTQVNTGLTNHDVNCLAISPDASILAGTQSGAFRSTNGGATWSKISSIYSLRIFGLSVGPSGAIFATGDYLIYRSTNNGSTWSIMDTEGSYQCLRGVIAFAGNTVLVGTSGCTILRSTNNGVSWTELTDGMLGVRSNVITQSASGRLLAGGYGIVYTSDDEGATWIRRTNDFSSLPVYALTCDSIGTIFAGTWADTVYRSTDNGVNWSWAGNGMTDEYVMSLAANSRDQLFAGTYFGGAFKSTDGGDNWAAAADGLTDAHVEALAVGPGDVLYAGTYSTGIFRSTNDAESWSSVGYGVVGSSVRDIRVKPDGTVFAATNAGVYRSTDNGSTWSQVRTGSWDALALDAGGRVFAAYYDTVYVTSNNGGSWSSISTGLTGTWITGLCVNGTGRIFASTYASGVYRSRIAPAP